MNFNFTKNQKIFIIIWLAIALIALIAGGFSAYKTNHSGITVIEPERSGRHMKYSSNNGDVFDEKTEVVFHIVGCVKKPGLYTLYDGCRLNDAIKSAGGATTEADINAVNLARKITDGEKIVIPSKLEAAERSLIQSGAVPVASSSVQTGSSAQSGTPAKVNINTATAEELDLLPGVGPSTAKKIIDYRNQIGGFSSVDQLNEVSGIGPKKYDGLKDMVTL